MATVGELARQHTALTKEETTHVVNLIGEWGMLADLCFADLMLHAPTTDGQWVVLAQVRAATGQTLYVTDFVGTLYGAVDQPLVTEAFRTGEVCEGETKVAGSHDECLMMAIPVRHEGRTVAVLTREWSQRSGRQPGELERTYLDLFDRFSVMVAMRSRTS